MRKDKPSSVFGWHHLSEVSPNIKTLSELGQRENSLKQMDISPPEPKFFEIDRELYNLREEEDTNMTIGTKIRDRADSNVRKRSGTAEIKLRLAPIQIFDKINLKKSPGDRVQESSKNSDRQSSKHNMASQNSDKVSEKHMTTEEIRQKVIDRQQSSRSSS